DSVACGFVAPLPSPDGRWVLFRGIGGEDAPGLVHPGSPLWLARADGSSPRLISPVAGVQAAWTPDSSRFAYTADDGLHIAFMRGLRDQKARGGSTCGRCGVAWSPDGKTLAFFDTSGHLVLTRQGHERTVFSINDPGGLL